MFLERQKGSLWIKLQIPCWFLELALRHWGRGLAENGRGACRWSFTARAALHSLQVGAKSCGRSRAPQDDFISMLAHFCWIFLCLLAPLLSAVWFFCLLFFWRHVLFIVSKLHRRRWSFLSRSGISDNVNFVIFKKDFVRGKKSTSEKLAQSHARTQTSRLLTRKLLGFLYFFIKYYYSACRCSAKSFVFRLTRGKWSSMSTSIGTWTRLMCGR